LIDCVDSRLELLKLLILSISKWNIINNILMKNPSVFIEVRILPQILILTLALTPKMYNLSFMFEKQFTLVCFMFLQSLMAYLYFYVSRVNRTIGRKQEKKKKVMMMMMMPFPSDDEPLYPTLRCYALLNSLKHRLLPQVRYTTLNITLSPSSSSSFLHLLFEYLCKILICFVSLTDTEA
jgi:hypothetical protein